MAARSLFSRLRRWLVSRSSASRSGPLARRPLQVEALEDRTVPATLTLQTVFANQVFVSTVFQQFLGRPADPAGFFIFTAQLNMGATPQQIIQEIFASPEFQARRAASLTTTGLGTMFPATLSGSAFFTPFAATTSPTVFSSASTFGSVPFAREFSGGSIPGTTFPGTLFPSPTFRGAFASGFPF